METPADFTAFIKKRAAELGFSGCGIAPVACLDEDIIRFDEWLTAKRNAAMGYMERNREKRLDPGKLVEGAKSVVVFLSNYFPEQSMDADAKYLISRYAYGSDYHEVIMKKLEVLISELRLKRPEIHINGYNDSAPVLEKAWAARAGLGWIGKNSLLVTPERGSFFFLSELITDLELEYDSPLERDYCGTCDLCLNSCPTGAIVAPAVIDAGRCISNLTVENKGELPEHFKGTYKQWIFGCDICQQVCPWNRFAIAHSEPAFLPSENLYRMQAEDWENLELEQFYDLFRHTPVKRAKFEGLKRNIRFLEE